MGTSQDRIVQLAEDIRQYKADGTHKRLSEQDTKAVFVEPLLEIVGWDVRDPAQVSREDRPTERPVDYSLKLEGEFRVLVECKRLSNQLDNPKDLEQAVSYAANAGVKWCVLTNGALVRIYNSLAPEVAANKLLEELDLAKVGEPEGVPVDTALEVLSLISPQAVQSGEIDRHWDRRYTGAKVRDVIGSLFRGPDPDLVNLVRRRMKAEGQILTRKSVRQWLETLDVRVYAPTTKPRTKPTKRPKPRPARERTTVISTPGSMRIGRDSFDVRYSNEILTNTAEWLVTKGKLGRSDCPVPIGHTRNLVNTKPIHRSGSQFKAPKQLSNGLWVEANHSGSACITFARHLLERFGYGGDVLEVE